MNLELLAPLAEALFENWNPESFNESLLVPVGAGSVKEEVYMY